MTLRDAISSSETLKLCRECLATDRLRRFIESEHLLGPNVRSDADLPEYVRKTGGMTFHQHLPHGS